MPEWFYVENEVQRGPISEGELARIFADHRLPLETLVWTPELGEEWQTAAQTRLVKRSASTPPRLPNAPQPDPVSAATANGFRSVSTPVPATAIGPAVATTSYNDRQARWIAYLPLAVIAGEIIFFVLGSNSVPSGVYEWAGIGGLFFAYNDSKRLTAAGLNPHGLYVAPFMLLTPIGYFWRRYAVTGASLTPLWVWLGLTGVFMVVDLALFPQG